MSLSQRRPSQRQDNLSLDGLETILEGGADQSPSDHASAVPSAGSRISDRHIGDVQDWTIQETMRSLGVSRGNVLRRIEAGELVAYKVERSYGVEWRVRPPGAVVQAPPATAAEKAKTVGRPSVGQISEALKREVFESRARAGLLSDMLKDAQTRLDGASMLIGCQRVQLEEQKSELAEQASLRAEVAGLFAEIGDWMNLCWERDRRILELEFELESEINRWMNRLWQADVRQIKNERSWWYRFARRLNLI